MKKLMITGTNSGCGKTSVTCGVLQAISERGLSAAAFKCGPDYIDPAFHRHVTGIAAGNLDSRFCGGDRLNCLLDRNDADIAVIEGVMGFYDGVGERYSSCETSLLTGTPAAVVIDCKGMSLSVGAVMKGFLTFRPNRIAGFIFNRLPESQTDTAKRLCEELGTEYLGRFPYCPDIMLESRHLGLVTADETARLRDKLHRMGQLAEDNIRIDRLLEIAASAQDIPYEPPRISPLTDAPVRIAAARDRAFCFYYEETFELLRGLGCEIAEFSPLADEKLPEKICGLILGGGYPELYAKALSENVSMRDSVRNAVTAGLPTIAECGGFMYLNRTLEGNDGRKYDMVGVYDGDCYKTDSLKRFGYGDMTAQRDNLLCKKGEVIRSHEFHYWDCTDIGGDFYSKRSRGGNYCVHADKRIYAGFPHLYLYGDISAAENFVKACLEYRNGKNR
ncbi:MAG: cobyrinate a,c-diamide synthase [Oscillospiraceae bacterium]|nr:cobyrinate a,c-diamide synthase [Oscillospiraceae bacterium]